MARGKLQSGVLTRASDDKDINIEISVDGEDHTILVEVWHDDHDIKLGQTFPANRWNLNLYDHAKAIRIGERLAARLERQMQKAGQQP